MLILHNQQECVHLLHVGLSPADRFSVDEGNDAVLDDTAVPVPVPAVLDGACMLVTQVPMHCTSPKPIYTTCYINRISIDRSKK
jgi:hypothetical protein